MQKLEFYKTMDGTVHPSVQKATEHEQTQLENFFGAILDKTGWTFGPGEKLRLMERLVPSVYAKDKTPSFRSYEDHAKAHLETLIRLANNYLGAISFLEDEKEED